MVDFNKKLKKNIFKKKLEEMAGVYSVRVEGWNGLGINLGNHSIKSKFKNGLEGAKELAREYWREASYWKYKQVTIADIDGNRIWMFKDGILYEANEHGKLEEIKIKQ